MFGHSAALPVVPSAQRLVPSFAEFTGNHVIDFSGISQQRFINFMELTKIGNLERLYQQFPNDLHLYTAYAFKESRITHEQLGTLLLYNEMASNPQEFRNLKIKKMDSFRDISLASLPATEQLVFTYEIDIENHPMESFLRFAAARSPALELDDKEVTLQSYGINRLYSEHHKHVVTFMPRVDEFSIDDIERCMRGRARYIAVKFPGIKSSRTFHGLTSNYVLYNTIHDILHAHLLSSIQPDLHTAYLNGIDLVRKTYQQKWSKGIWNGIDLEVDGLYFGFTNIYDDTQTNPNILIYERTEDFIRLLSAPIASTKQSMQLFEGSPLSDMTWLLMIDLQLNPKWKTDFLIDIDLTKEKNSYFTENYYRYTAMYEFVKQYEATLKTIINPLERIVFIKRAYFGLEHNKELIEVVRAEKNKLCIHSGGKLIIPQQLEDQYKLISEHIPKGKTIKEFYTMVVSMEKFSQLSTETQLLLASKLEELDKFGVSVNLLYDLGEVKMKVFLTNIPDNIVLYSKFGKDLLNLSDALWEEIGSMRYFTDKLKKLDLMLNSDVKPAPKI